MLYEAGRVASRELAAGVVEDGKSGSVRLIRSMIFGQKASVGAGVSVGGRFEEEEAKGSAVKAGGGRTIPREVEAMGGWAGRLDSAGLVYGAATSRAFPFPLSAGAAEVDASAPPAVVSPTAAPRSLASCAFAFTRSLWCSTSSLATLSCE